VQELLECKLRGIRILELSSFFERENGHLQLDSMNASWMILAEGFNQGILRDTVKRLFDLLVSAAMLAVTLPIMALTALLIKLESPGPVLYRQERVGQGGRSFTILKFRSMCVDAEKDGKPRWARPERQPRHAHRALHPAHPHRRAAADIQRVFRRHELRRPAPRTPLFRART
jgi:lipopolysaccharide/colanic/teichoic acid biosynthesis glycosyltransferase